MKLLIFGATGATGKQLVAQALNRGHSVRAFVRDERKLDIEHEQLQTVAGDIHDRESVDRAFDGHVDAVISALGVYHREPRTELSAGTRNVLEIMAQHGVSRLGVVTSLGVGDSKGQGNLIARLFQRIMLPHVLADKERQEAIIRASSCDWTVLRPPQLTASDKISPDVVIWQGATPDHPKLSWKSSRATVAHVLLDVLEQGLYSRAAINISDPR